MKVLQVPLHNVMLHSDLFEGQVTVGVRPALPTEGISLILENGVAGGPVWAGVLPPPAVLSLVPLLRKQPDENEVNFPKDFTACVVTCSMARDKLDSVSGSEQLESNNSGLCAFSLSDTSPSVLQEDLRLEQQADPSLRALFEQVLPADEVQSHSRGYFMHDALLTRKWVPYGGSFIGDPVIQIVLPSKYRESVLRLAHDESGH